MDCGLYIHVPFCRRRCPYCDFVLIESDGSLHDAYVNRVHREMREAGMEQDDLTAKTLYFGGGTPSMLTPHELDVLLITAKEEFELPADAEVTLEVNPEAVDGREGQWIHDRKPRISLGIQSFHQGELKYLGREHTPATAEKAYKRLLGAGVSNLNIDLMFGLPGSTLESWKENLMQAAALDPNHISLYGLTYEKGTGATRLRDSGRIPALDDSLERDQYRMAMETLRDLGYTQYEVSNFAKPGWESVHNRIYWNREPYLGFGAGAHSFLPENRWWNISNVKKYTTAEEVVWSAESLTPEQQRLERIMLGLRTTEGIQLDDDLKARSAEVVEKGLAVVEDGNLRLTDEGRCVADAVIDQVSG